MGEAKTVVVLGGGVGGGVTARELRKRLPRQHRVVLIDREREHVFAPSLLWLMVGLRRAEAMKRPLGRLQRKGIDVHTGEVEAVDAEARRVTVGGETLTADHLVLRDEILSIYARVAEDPAGDFHFHRGADYAVGWLGYDRDRLGALPTESTSSFAGVANPHRLGSLAEGAVAVDIGCGAGMDLLLAAQDVGPRGRAIGVDMTDAMAERARASARAAGLEHVEVRVGDAMSLPLEDSVADAVLSNGVLNLVPDKSIAYAEVFRVLKPGGRFHYGDIVVASELSESIRRDIDLWTG